MDELIARELTGADHEAAGSKTTTRGRETARIDVVPGPQPPVARPLPAPDGFSFGCGVADDLAEIYEPVVTDGRLVGDFTAHEVGETGERAACRYLVKAGLEVVERNWRCRLGEADIVARDGDTIVLVEVKTTVSLGDDIRYRDPRPEERVDEAKRRRYRDIALFYLATHPGVTSVRFDVAALTVVEEGRAQIRYIPGAFFWDE